MNAIECPTIAVLAAALVSGCSLPANAASSATASPPPAKIVTENDLNSVVLTPQAEQRLGIVTAAVETRKVERSRALGGELLLPLGPTAGSTNGPKSIYSLLPAMSATELVRLAELQIEADGQFAAAQIQLNAAKLASARAESLMANKSGTQRAMDEARAQALLAEAALETARERRALLGAPIFTAVRKERLWLRVPVYAGDLERIDRSAPAQISSLGNRTNNSVRTAQPISVPISPAGASTTVDLFYELENPEGTLRPGQKVSVAVPLLGEQESLLVPVDAVLYDIHGGAWVYENTAPHTFSRRRIEVRFVSKGNAVLARGPKAGTKVVTAGAAELFGAEFGIGK